MPKKPFSDMPEMPMEMPAVKKPVRRKKPSLSPAASQPPVLRPEPPRRPAKKSSAPLAVGVLVVLIIIAFGAYSVSVYFKNKAAEEAALQEAKSAEETAAATAEETAADPAADWLEFTFPPATTTAATSSIAMSFKYPNTLSLTQNPDNLILSSESVSSTQVNIYWVKSKKSLGDYITALDKANATGWEGKPSVSVVTSTEAVVISGLPAVFRQQKLLAADLNQYIAYIKAADTVYAVSLAAPELNENLLAFFVVFLNNFKLQ